jgi:lipopolysaccharide/colanic/teichoic acid biosynthesis glycosyltransferase
MQPTIDTVIFALVLMFIGVFAELLSLTIEAAYPEFVTEFDRKFDQMVRLYWLKRLFDFTVALFGLVCLAPAFAIIAVAIKRSSPGPVFYAQTRVGKGGRLFRLIKFRSMVANADKLGSSVTKAHDPRITPIGRVLRRTKIDELPQFWNVLMGDMSFVGPRPDVPEIVAGYGPNLRPVLDVRPGITSIASLLLRNEEQILSLCDDPDTAYVSVVVPMKVKLAMSHAKQASLWFDLSILLQTVWVLSFGRIQQPAEHPSIKALRQSLSDYNRRGTSFAFSQGLSAEGASA